MTIKLKVKRCIHTSEPDTLIPRHWEADHGEVNKLVAMEEAEGGDGMNGRGEQEEEWK